MIQNEYGSRTAGVAVVLEEVESGPARAHAEAAAGVGAERTLGEAAGVVGELVGGTSRRSDAGSLVAVESEAGGAGDADRGTQTLSAVGEAAVASPSDGVGEEASQASGHAGIALQEQRRLAESGTHRLDAASVGVGSEPVGTLEHAAAGEEEPTCADVDALVVAEVGSVGTSAGSRTSTSGGIESEAGNTGRASGG